MLLSWGIGATPDGNGDDATVPHHQVLPDGGLLLVAGSPEGLALLNVACFLHSPGHMFGISDSVQTTTIDTSSPAINYLV